MKCKENITNGLSFSAYEALTKVIRNSHDEKILKWIVHYQFYIHNCFLCSGQAKIDLFCGYFLTLKKKRQTEFKCTWEINQGSLPKCTFVII